MIVKTKSQPILVKWSEYRDSNPGPSGPKPDALPDCAILRYNMVRLEGLEPPRREAPEPKSGVSTNFTTWAYGAG